MKMTNAAAELKRLNRLVVRQAMTKIDLKHMIFDLESRLVAQGLSAKELCLDLATELNTPVSKTVDLMQDPLLTFRRQSAYWQSVLEDVTQHTSEMNLEPTSVSKSEQTIRQPPKPSRRHAAPASRDETGLAEFLCFLAVCAIGLAFVLYIGRESYERTEQEIEESGRRVGQLMAEAERERDIARREYERRKCFLAI